MAKTINDATKSFEDVTKSFEDAMKPVAEFNNFMFKTSETTLAKQVECYKAYAKISMDNLNEGFKIRSFEDMIAYTEKQKDVAQKTSDLFISEAKNFTELNTKFVEEARTLIEKSVKNSVENVKAAA